MPMSVKTIREVAETKFPALARKRDFEQTSFAGFLMACRANHVEVTEALVEPYQRALNAATRALWKALYDAGYQPGKTPKIRFDAKIVCTAACQHAQGFECVCGCGGANHGLFAVAHSLSKAKDPASYVRNARTQAREQMADLNAFPANRIRVQMGRIDRALGAEVAR